MANIDKLEAVLDYIRMHPEEHDQRNWVVKTACGTTMCFAGTTVALAGYEIEWTGASLPVLNSRGEEILALDWASQCSRPGDVFKEYVETAAADELGLTAEQTIRLFYGAKTFEGVEQVVKDIVNQERG